MALRSLIETVACRHLIRRRHYLEDASPLDKAYRHSEILSMKLHALRKAIAPEQPWVREEGTEYLDDSP